MDTSQEPTFDQDLSTVVSQLPTPIRSFFINGKVEVVVKDLMQKYRLHVDQGAIMEREIILLLLGLKDPTEFTKSLSEEAQIDQQTINGVVQDINDQIFIPIQAEMKDETVRSVQKQPKPASSRLPAITKQTAAASAPTYAPPPQSPSYSSSKNNIASSDFTHPVLKRTDPPSLSATKIAVRAAMSAVKKPIVDEKLLEDHEELHIEFNKVPQSLSRPVTPLPPPFPPNLPGVKLPTPPTRPASSIARPYSSDPYREPIDEKEK